MNDTTVASEPHSLPADDSGHRRDLVRDVSEVRGEVRVLCRRDK